MIGFLSGIVKIKEKGGLIIDCHGVGYLVKTPFFDWEKSQLDKAVQFFVYTHVREDSLSLFGFSKKEDKDIFCQLLTVSGIGPKNALAIVSFANGYANIIKAIQNADVSFFKSIKGIGQKSSQKIIIDLKSKAGGIKDLELETYEDKDLMTALKQLEFTNEEIKKAIKGINHKLNLEEKLRFALTKIHAK